MSTYLENLLVSKEELCQMIDLQEELNTIYSGENWRSKVLHGWIESAVLAEYAEYLDEVQDEWCWYKKTNTIDRNKALFELVDVVHFCLMAMLYYNGDLVLKSTLSTEMSEPYMNLLAEDEFKVMNRAISRFLQAVDLNSPTKMMCHLRNIIELGGAMLDLSPGEVFTAYKMKNMRNRERVFGGIMEGKYDKSKEIPLQLL